MSASSSATVEDQRELLIDRVLDAFAQLGQRKHRSAFDHVSLDELRETLDELQADIDRGFIDEPDDETPQPKKAREKGRAIKTGEGLFLKMPIDAAVDPRLSHFERTLLAVIIILCGQKGHCWHSVASIAKQMPGTNGKMGHSTRQVQRGLKRIEACDYISIVPANRLKKAGFDHRTKTDTYVLAFELR